VSECDVLVHGYRPGALTQLGYDEMKLRSLNPRFIDVALSAYGWSGPWAGRRGFDSLVQMSSGIADEGKRRAIAEKPTPLPVQARSEERRVGKEGRSGWSACQSEKERRVEAVR